MSMNHPSACFLLSAILSLSVTCAAAESDPVPGDFKLYAQYGPGYNGLQPWKVTVTADGKASQETYASRSGNENTTQKTFALTAKDLQQLLAIVRASRFFDLKKDYSYPVSDNRTLTLRVTMNGNSHEVKVYAPDLLKDNDEVKRFLKLWNEVLKKVPAPNAEQKPEWSGVVQSSRFEQDRYELSLGTTSSSDYVLVDMGVVFGLQGPVAIQRGSPAERSLADKYVGKRLRVSGEIQRDTAGRRFIHVTQLEQIEFP